MTDLLLQPTGNPSQYEEHLYQLTAKAMKGEQDEFGRQDQASRLALAI